MNGNQVVIKKGQQEEIIIRNCLEEKKRLKNIIRGNNENTNYEEVWYGKHESRRNRSRSMEYYREINNANEKQNEKFNMKNNIKKHRYTKETRNKFDYSKNK